jgi:hypothetical protein
MRLDAIPKILLVGAAGAGKSSLIPTLPWYGTDEEMEDMDKKGIKTEDDIVEYQGRYICSFLTDPQGMEAYAHGAHRMKVYQILSNPGAKLPLVHKKPTAGAKAKFFPIGFDQYQRFAAKVNAMIAAGSLDKYKWVVIDSLTFLTDSILMEIAEKETRLGYKYTQEDYGRVATLIKIIISILLSKGLPLVMTAHSSNWVLEVDDQGNPKKVLRQLSAYGKLREHFPAMFNNTFDLRIEHHGDKSYRKMLVLADGSDNYTRTTLHDIEEQEFDVTLDYHRSTREQGLHSLFSKFRSGIIEGMDMELV